jgi:hypothetical protein
VDSTVNFMILEVAPPLCAIKFCIPVAKYGVLLQEVSGIVMDFFDVVKEAFVFSFYGSQCDNLLDILGNWHNIENRDIDGSHDKEMEVNDVEKRQCLIIRVSSLSSTASFSLDIVIQHCVIIG